MNPPAEQLVRDYLNQVSLASRGRLRPAERHALLVGTRASIDRALGMSGLADANAVRGIISVLGDPADLVGRYRDRLDSGPGNGHRDGGAGGDSGAGGDGDGGAGGDSGAGRDGGAGGLREPGTSVTGRWLSGAELPPRPRRRPRRPRRLPGSGPPKRRLREGQPREGLPREGPPREGLPRQGPPREGPPREGPPQEGPSPAEGRFPPAAGPEGAAAGPIAAAAVPAPDAGSPRSQLPVGRRQPGRPRRQPGGRRSGRPRSGRCCSAGPRSGGC